MASASLMIRPPSLSSLLAKRFPALRIQIGQPGTLHNDAVLPNDNLTAKLVHIEVDAQHSQRPRQFYGRPAEQAEAADHWTKRFPKYRPALFDLGGAVVQNPVGSA